MTRSLSTRPWMRESSSTSASSRGVRAAKSAWPPSEGDGTKRPSTLCSSASPRPVPAAISAALPVGTAMPSCSTASSSGSSTGTASAMASRSLSEPHRAPSSRRRRRDASAIHGTLVSRATSPVTGPATPMHTASTVGCPVSSRNVSTMSSRLSKSSVAYSRTTCADGPVASAAEQTRAASSCRRRRRREASPIIPRDPHSCRLTFGRAADSS